MKTTIKTILHYSTAGYDAENPWRLFSCDMSLHGFAVIGPREIKIDVPDKFDPRPGIIAGLKAKEQKARADFELLVTDIRRQISQHEAISMDEPS